MKTGRREESLPDSGLIHNRNYVMEKKNKMKGERGQNAYFFMKIDVDTK